LGETLISKRIEVASESGVKGLNDQNEQKAYSNQESLYQSGSQLNWIAQHPPAYYSLLKIYYPLVAWMDVNSAIFWLRMSSILLGILTITFTYLTVTIVSQNGKNDREKNHLPLLAAGFLAFLPDFSFISAVLNNDNLVICLSAGLMYLMAEFINHKNTRHLFTQGSLMAAVIGLLLITKATSLPVIIAAVLFEVYYLTFKRRQPLLDLLKFFLLQIVIIMAMAGWWYIYNYQEFHTFLPDIATVVQLHPELLDKHVYLKTLFPEVNGVKDLVSPYDFFITKNFFWNYFVNIWGVFGAGFISLSMWQIIAYVGLMFSAICGYCKQIISPVKAEHRYKSHPMNLYFALLVGILLAAITYKLFQIAQARGFLGAMHGRYFLPAMIPMGYWIFAGIQKLLNNRQSDWVMALIFFFFVINEMITIICVIIPSFY
jgi:hypothetical protein